MAKYDLLPTHLKRLGIATTADFFEPSGLCPREDVLRVHGQAYFDRLVNLELTDKEMRAVGFPLSRKLIDRELTIAQGSIDGALKALDTGIAMNIAGGTHHAFSHRAEAFCLLNDQAIAAAYLIDHNLAKQILIIDLDVHQGNGTAEIFRDEPRVFTFSMHGASNYPFKKEVSDLDIALPDSTGDGDYLRILSETLDDLLASVRPDFVFYLSGVDVLISDKLGRLGLTPEGCARRDELVFSKLKEVCLDKESLSELKRTHDRIPVQCSMGGGYSPDLAVILDAHAATFAKAKNYLI